MRSALPLPPSEREGGSGDRPPLAKKGFWDPRRSSRRPRHWGRGQQLRVGAARTAPSSTAACELCPAALRSPRTPHLPSPTTCQLLPNLLLPFWRPPTWESSHCVRQEAELGCDWSLSLLPKPSPSYPADHTPEKPLTRFCSPSPPLCDPRLSWFLPPHLPQPLPPPPATFPAGTQTPAAGHRGPESSDGSLCLLDEAQTP